MVIIRIIKHLLAVLCLLLLICPVFADPNPLFVLPQSALYGGLGASEDPVPPKSGLRTGILPNGMRYYILENSLPQNRSYLTLAVNAGSLLEEEHERGLAHFVEHMAFNGTARFPGMELVNYLRSLGMRFGPEINAFTGFEQTVYGIEAPVEQGSDGIKRIPDRALAIIDDWTWAISFDPEDVEKERLVILEEYRTRLGAWERVRQQTLPVIFRGSRYADRLPIGLPDIIQNASAVDLMAYYRKWYRPDNMAVILVGDFDGAVLEQELAAHFTAPAQAAPIYRPTFELPLPQSGSVISAVISDEELPSSVVYLYYKRSPQVSAGNLFDYRENLINDLIEIMIDFRFSEAIALGDTPYMAATIWHNHYGNQSRYTVKAGSSKAGRSAETLEALLLEKERLVRFGFTQTELNRAKTVILSALDRMAAESDRRDSNDFINELTAVYLSNAYAPDPQWELDAIQRLLPAISLRTINSSLRDYYIDDDLTVVIVSPEAEAVPDEAFIQNLVQSSSSIEISPPGEREAVSGLVKEDFIPGTIVSINQDQSGAEIWELSNGMQLVLMETANRNNELSLYALAKGGTLSADVLLEELGFSREEAFFSARLAAEILNTSGLGSLSRSELMDFLSDKQLSLSLWTASYIRGLQGTSTLRDIPVFFEMIHALFSQPQADQSAFNRIMDQHRTRLSREMDNPDAVFSRERSSLIHGNHSGLRPLQTEDLEKISENAVLAFLTLALNPADYTLVFAGSLGDMAVFRELTEQYLASIPNDTLPRWDFWTDPELGRPVETERMIHMGREERSIVYMGWFAPKTWTELDNAAALVLNEYLDIVLNDEIRETLGGVYSISTRASLALLPAGELSIEVYFICDPGRETELREAVKNQLAFLMQAVDEETFLLSKEALVRSFERSMERNNFIAQNLANFYAVIGVPLSHLAQRPELYQSVKREQLPILMAEILAAGPVELVLFPQAGGIRSQLPQN